MTFARSLRASVIVVCALFVASCGSSPTSPTPTATTPTPTPSPTPTPTPTPTPSPSPTPTPTSAALTGTVTIAQGGSSVSGATVRVLDGSASGRTTTTDSSGRYRFDGLPIANTNFSATASGYTEDRRGTFVNGTNTLNFTLQAPLYSRSGTGDNVFTIPTYVTRIRIQGTYTGSCQNFIVHIAGRGVVNEILGTCSIASGTRFDGTYVTSGGVAEVLNSTGVSWTFTEVR